MPRCVEGHKLDPRGRLRQSSDRDFDLGQAHPHDLGRGGARRGRGDLVQPALDRGSQRRASRAAPDVGRSAISRQAALVVESVANASAHAIANTQYTDIPPVLDAAMREDKAGVDQLQWISIADATGAVVAATPGAPAGAKLAELDKLLPPGDDVAHARVGTGSDWIYGAPIKIGGSAIGTIRIGVTTAGLEAELAKSLAEAGRRAQASRSAVADRARRARHRRGRGGSAERVDRAADPRADDAGQADRDRRPHDARAGDARATSSACSRARSTS